MWHRPAGTPDYIPKASSRLISTSDVHPPLVASMEEHPEIAYSWPTGATMDVPPTTRGGGTQYRRLLGRQRAARRVYFDEARTNICKLYRAARSGADAHLTSVLLGGIKGRRSYEKRQDLARNQVSF
jgi:hypothetical protein